MPKSTESKIKVERAKMSVVGDYEYEIVMKYYCDCTFISNSFT